MKKIFYLTLLRHRTRVATDCQGWRRWRAPAASGRPYRPGWRRRCQLAHSLAIRRQCGQGLVQCIRSNDSLCVCADRHPCWHWHDPVHRLLVMRLCPTAVHCRRGLFFKSDEGCVVSFEQLALRSSGRRLDLAYPGLRGIHDHHCHCGLVHCYWLDSCGDPWSNIRPRGCGSPSCSRSHW